MKPANNAPLYAACLYPQLAEIARSHGYALAVHGSLARDFDIVCIPWADQVSPERDVVEAISKAFNFKLVGEPTIKKHNRRVYTLAVMFGECFLDLSFTPNN